MTTVPPDQRTIFAMGGAQFTRLAANEALHEWILQLAGPGRPRLCLLPTAGGDSDEQIAGYYRTFTPRPCEPSHVSLFRLGSEKVKLREHLLSQDLIYVGGGSMVNLLAIWRAHGVEEVLREAWEGGTVLCGLSAGAMCWFEAGVTTGSGVPSVVEGIGLLPGSACVHYGSEPERRGFYLGSIAGGLAPGYGIDDHAGLLWRGTEPAGAYSGTAGAGVQWVDAVDGIAVEAPLATTALEPPAISAPTALDELRRVREMRELSERQRPGAVPARHRRR